MPPFHRMPIFYLVILIPAAWLAARTWGPTGSSPVDQVEPPATSVNEAKPSLIEDDASEPDDGILRTADGLRRKVLVRDLNVIPRFGPGDNRRAGLPLEYFSIHYVYDESPAADPEFLEVGPMEGPPVGWVPREAVLNWDTRLMAKPTPRDGRPPVVIYRDQACLLDTLAGRDCPRHQGPCPIEGEESSAADTSEAVLGWPILQSRAIPQPDGSHRTVFEVATLVRDQAPPPPPSEPPARMQRALKRVYLAFVIDTTASMQGYIDAARELAAELVAEAAERDVTLRLALVEFRDDSPIFGFKVRVVTSFTDEAGFRSALNQIEAAERGDGTVDEAVLDGLAAALPPAPDAPIGTGAHVSWPSGRDGELATKLVVLLGDAPDHARDLERTNALAALARDAGITIAAVAIDRPGSLSRDEAERYEAQWKALAEGSYRPRDPNRGFQEPMPPITPSLNDAGEFASLLQALIEDRIEHARQLAALALAEAEGRLQDYVTRQGLTLDQIAPVLVDLHGGRPRPEPRPDPQHLGRKAPSVRRGWIAREQDGSELVSLQMWMSREELDVLIDELSQLQQAAQGGAADLADLLQIGTAAAAGETAFLAGDRGDRTFAQHLRRRQGLPPPPPDSLLQRSQADLLHADDLTRAALDARLSRSLGLLIRQRRAIDWDSPSGTIEGMTLIPYETVDF